MDEFTVLTEAPYKGICQCLCYLSMLAITVWGGLSFKLSGPHCSVQQFYVPGLDLTDSPPPNTTTAVNPCLFFDLAFQNILDDRSIRYGDVNVTFSYGRTAVANYTVPSFYQGKGKTAHRREVVETRGVPWDDAIEVVSNGSKAVFRVDVAARPRFRFWFWYSRKKGVRLGSDVEVGPTGMKLDRNDIRLNLAAPKPGLGLLLLSLNLFVAAFLFT